MAHDRYMMSAATKLLETATNHERRLTAARRPDSSLKSELACSLLPRIHNRFNGSGDPKGIQPLLDPVENAIQKRLHYDED
jgi:hypothetical protein